MSPRRVGLLFAAALASGACVQAPVRPPEAPHQPVPVDAPAPGALGSEARGPVKTDPAITNALVAILEKKDRERVDLSKAEGTPIGEILKIGSPIGYTLRNRYLNIGVPLAEALSRDADPNLRQKLVELARWDGDAETRSAALVAVARTKDARDLNIFREALVHINPAIRFGALEALIAWGHPEMSLPLLAAASERDYEPILRVYAAAGLAKLGDGQGLHRLRAFLDDHSWLVRAMAARYLGEYGTAEDYDIMVSRIGREQSNDFTAAEFCISALKLFAKKP